MSNLPLFWQIVKKPTNKNAQWFLMFKNEENNLIIYTIFVN